MAGTGARKCADSEEDGLLEDMKGRCEEWARWGRVKLWRRGRGHALKAERHFSRLFT